MRTFRVELFTLLAGVLFGLGLSVPAAAETVILDKSTPKCTSGTQCASLGVLSGEGFWNFTVTVTGKVSLLGMQIKDNAPGAEDICWGWSGRKPSGMFQVGTGPILIPAADVNACGTQWLNDTEPELALHVYFQSADPKANIVIDFSYPPPPVVSNHLTGGTASGRRVAMTLQKAWAIKRSSWL